MHLLPDGTVAGDRRGGRVFNGAHLQVEADPHAGRAVVMATTDNLGKGVAGRPCRSPT